MGDADAKPIRVMIVDDHAMVRDGLKVFLSNYADIHVVAEADDGAEAVSLMGRVRPDVVLMDLVMPGLDGPAATERIRNAHPGAQVIALTSFIEEDLIRRTLRAGAVGYLLKDVNPARLAEAIRAAHRGRPTIDSAAAQALARGATDRPAPGHDLTAREREVLALLVQGKTNDEIGRALFISAATVRLHVSHILAKLEASNRTEAATIAARLRLVPLEG